MAADKREWIGKSVDVQPLGLEVVFVQPLGLEVVSGNKEFQILLTEKATRTLALALMRLRQTTIPLPGDVQELLDALNYVTVGDPDSRAAHRRLEAGKGMTPDGGYKAPSAVANASQSMPGKAQQTND